MGRCLSKCLPESDMATELEQELDEDPTGRYEEIRGSGLPHSTLLQSSEVELKEQVGQGVSGIVYKGAYRGSQVAIKKVPIIGAALKPREVELALEKEAGRMGSLRHPNIVLFMGACLSGTDFCIISEFCSRGSLYDVLQHGPSGRNHANLDKASQLPHNDKATSLSDSQNGSKPASRHSSALSGSKSEQLPWSLRCRLALGAARGLLYLHSADPPLVHRDLKSTNILVDDSWNAKLADFGTHHVATVVGGHKRTVSGGEGASDLTKTGIIESWRWEAPEVLKHGHDGPFAKREAMDIYSFGIVLWEMITFSAPYEEKDKEFTITAVCNGVRPDIPPNSCPAKWESLVRRCWDENPDLRPPATELVSTLEELHAAETAGHGSHGKRGYRRRHRHPSRTNSHTRNSTGTGTYTNYSTQSSATDTNVSTNPAGTQSPARRSFNDVLVDALKDIMPSFPVSSPSGRRKGRPLAGDSKSTTTSESKPQDPSFTPISPIEVLQQKEVSPSS